jgi:hypothetical protein
MAKELDQLIKEVQLPSQNYQEPQYNPFDAPVQGESLTNTPGAAAWEHPPAHAKMEDAIEFITERITERENGMRVLTLMDIGIPIEALVKIITFSGFLEGKWTVDVAKMLEPMVAMLLAQIAKTAKLNNVRVSLKDPTDKQFMEDATIQEMAMKQDEMAGEESIPGLTEAAAPAGLMTRPTAGV